jgi:hypothetical protein
MVGIARWRSYASVLAIPQRKTSLCGVSMEGGHGQSWSSMGGSHGELTGEGKEGEGEEEAGGAAWERHGELLGEGAPRKLRAARSCVVVLLVVSAVREKKKRRGRRKERKKKRKEKKKKKKEKYGKFSKIENF